MKRFKERLILAGLGASIVLILSVAYYFVQSGKVQRESAKLIEFGLFR